MQDHSPVSESSLPQPPQAGSLRNRIEAILFGLNLLLALLGTVMIWRFRRTSIDLFTDFDVLLSPWSQAVLSLPVACLLPASMAVAVGVVVGIPNVRTRWLFHIGHTVLIFGTILLFLAGTLPAIQRLIDSLE